MKLKQFIPLLCALWLPLTAAAQKVPEVPMEDWDRSMSAVFTEEAAYDFMNH